MEFRNKKKSPLWVDPTDMGNTISYTFIREDKLVFFTKNAVVATKEAYTSEFVPVPKPTKLTLDCSFEVTAPMLDELESSKILLVVGLYKKRKQIVVYPLPFFDYVKFQDVLFDLCKKFEL